MKETWYYGTEEDLKGPFTKAEIQNLIGKRIIFPETLLWLEYEDSKTKKLEKKPYPAIKTQFSVLFPRHALTAVATDPKVPDYWLWIGAFYPFLVAIVWYSLYYRGWEPFPSMQMLRLIAATTIFTASFIAIDIFAMIRAGYQPPIYVFIISGFWLFPIYYFRRNRQMGRSQFSSSVSLVCWALALGMYFSFPFYTNADIARHNMWIANNRIIPAIRPEITAKSESVTVNRLPGLKFDITVHLSNGGTIKKTMQQSGRELKLIGDGMRISIPASAFDIEEMTESSMPRIVINPPD